jgi:hypothetical protein
LHCFQNELIAAEHALLTAQIASLLADDALFKFERRLNTLSASAFWNGTVSCPTCQRPLDSTAKRRVT